MLRIIRSLLMKIVNDIDAGNSNITEDEATKLIDTLKELTDKEKRLSKYAACEYLNMSRATFDNYVREGKLPKGKHEIGFKELSWSKKDLDEFIRKSKKVIIACLIMPIIEFIEMTKKGERVMVTQKKINIPIFNYKLTIVIFDKWEEVEHLFDGGPEPRAIVESHYGASLVAVNSKRGSSIVHEAEHIKNNIWDFIGYRPQRDNDKVDAYLITYIYDKIVDVFYKHDKVAK